MDDGMIKTFHIDLLDFYSFNFCRLFASTDCNSLIKPPLTLIGPTGPIFRGGLLLGMRGGDDGLDPGGGGGNDPDPGGGGGNDPDPGGGGLATAPGGGGGPAVDEPNGFDGLPADHPVAEPAGAPGGSEGGPCTCLAGVEIPGGKGPVRPGGVGFIAFLEVGATYGGLITVISWAVVLTDAVMFFARSSIRFLIIPISFAISSFTTSPSNNFSLIFEIISFICDSKLKKPFNIISMRFKKTSISSF